MTASAMFDALVHAGLSPQDSSMVERAQATSDEIISVTQTALSSAELSEAALFDREYREIVGSNPQRFQTALVEWADRVWRPILDRVRDRIRA